MLTSPLMTVWHQPKKRKNTSFLRRNSPEKIPYMSIVFRRNPGKIPFHTCPYISIPTKMGVFNDPLCKMTPPLTPPPFSFSPHRNAKDTRVVSWRQNGASSCALRHFEASAHLDGRLLVSNMIPWDLWESCMYLHTFGWFLNVSG